ncbi:MAG: tetratricopeptide repeat protein, partial [Bacteroidaceae bacterium]|nr:tetratricopeptide repeat protein [Bacteroidaceae bacterium]
RQQSAFYHPEIDEINVKQLVPLRLILSADADKLTPTLIDAVQQELNQQVSNGGGRNALVLRSIVASDSYNFTDAYDDATGALAADSLSITALLQRAYVGFLMAELTPESKMLKLTSVISDLEQLITHTQASWAPAYYNKAVVLNAMGRTKEAITQYSKAIELDAYLAPAYYNRALLYLEIGSQSEAEKDLSRAGELGLYKSYSLLKSSKSK